MIELSVGTLLGIGVLAALLVRETPAWLRMVAVGVVVLASLAPMLPILVLVPWHFIALHRGLVGRPAEPTTVALDDGWVIFTHPAPRACRRVRLASIHRARVARNDNWTQSKMLDDAVGLFDETRREVARIPLGSHGADELIATLARAQVPIDEVSVSAPTFLD